MMNLLGCSLHVSNQWVTINLKNISGSWLKRAKCSKCPTFQPICFNECYAVSSGLVEVDARDIEACNKAGFSKSEIDLALRE